MKRIKIDELFEIALSAFREALVDYSEILSKEKWQDLLVGEILRGNERIYSIYRPGERPVDALFIARARVNVYTGDASVEVFLDTHPDGLPHDEYYELD